LYDLAVEGRQLIDGSQKATDFPFPQAMHPEFDPCRINPSFSIQRFAFFTAIFLAMGLGAVLYFIFFAYPFGAQLTSAVYYTSAVVLYTFSSNRGLPGYFFSCPLVRRQAPRLALWHIGFLAALFVLQAAALGLLPHLPKRWHPAMASGVSPYAMPVLAISLCLALIQIFVYRRSLGRIHRTSIAP
jgi:hypothetical protein